METGLVLLTILAEIMIADFAADGLGGNFYCTDATILAANVTVGHGIHFVTSRTAIELRSTEGIRLTTTLRARFHLFYKSKVSYLLVQIMLERVALGSRQPIALCVEYLTKQISAKFEHIDLEQGLAALITCIICEVSSTTTEHSLIEYLHDGERCKGQLHQAEKLKPLILFLWHSGSMYYLLGGMTAIAYHTTLEEQYFINYGNLSFDKIWEFFDDQKLLAMLPSIHCRTFPEMEPSEMAMLVHSYYCQVEYGTTQLWSEEMHPLAMKYLLTLCSASTRLCELVKNYLLRNLAARMDKLSHNPLLLLEFILKWLKCEIAVEFVSDYANLQAQHPSCEKFFAAHYDQSCPTYVFTVGHLNTLWNLPGNPCTFCRRLDCYRCPVEIGKVKLPDALFYRTALTIYENYLHRKLIEIARSQGTRGAIDIWTRLTMVKTESDQRESWFSKPEMERIYREYLDKTEEHRRNHLSNKQLQIYLSNSAVNYRACFKVDDHYDPVVMEILFLIWTELRERQPEIECKAPLPASQGTKPTFRFEITEMGTFIATYWPPCMKALFERCRGERHLNNSERTRVSRFILDCRYEAEFARQLWREFFRNTDVGNCSEEVFWKEEYGVHFLYQEKATHRKLYPACGRMIELELCPLGDIEDVAQAACFRLGNETRGTLGKSQRQTWRIYGPMSYALMTQEN